MDITGKRAPAHKVATHFAGSHAELLMQGGSYARSWRMQMQADTASIV